MTSSKSGKQLCELHDLLFYFRIFMLPLEKNLLKLAFIECNGLINTLHFLAQIKGKLSSQLFINFKDI